MSAVPEELPICELLTSFVYDGDGNRVIKIEGGETILYINKYCEVNFSTSNATSYYYLGGKLIAQRYALCISTGSWIIRWINTDCYR
jgi:hypothetical protein